MSTAGDSRGRYPQTLSITSSKGINPVDSAYVHVVEGETGDPDTRFRSTIPCSPTCFDGVWSTMATTGQ